MVRFIVEVLCTVFTHLLSCCIPVYSSHLGPALYLLLKDLDPDSSPAGIEVPCYLYKSGLGKNYLSGTEKVQKNCSLSSENIYSV